MKHTRIVRHAAPVSPWRGVAQLLARLEEAPWVSLGRSARGARIAALRSGRGPALVIVGAIHGDEPASAYVVERWARERLRAANTGGRRAPRLLVIPALNPDGLAEHVKNNARDVDLNRNFPTRDFGTAARAGYDPGPVPASEPETRLFLRVCEDERVRAIVAVHQPLSCVSFDGPAREWAKGVAAACGLPARASVGYPTPGSMGTCFGVERGVPILTLELGRDPPRATWPIARRALDAAAEWATGALTRE